MTQQRDNDGTKLRVPRTYLQQTDTTAHATPTTVTSIPTTAATAANIGTAGTNNSGSGDSSSTVKLYQPANTDTNAYNMLKLYSLNGATIKALMRSRQQQVRSELQQSGVSQEGLQFAFKVTAEEHKLIYYRPLHPKSILLLGRSGTGKTTV